MNDLISRQAAIDELEERINANGYVNAALVSELNKCIGYIMRLPSAQPEITVGHALTEEEIKNIKQKMADSPLVFIPSAQPEISRIEQELHGKTPEEQYEFLYWLLLKFGLAYTDSRLAVIKWLRGEKL